LAALIVRVVVFAFLGSLRSVLIPIVTIPLSLVGTLIIMMLFGFSINLLTLLALVLAIGLVVVGGAIIVVENVNRQLEERKKPIAAAILAVRELGGPIIAMTVVLAAVYVPIGFQGGCERRRAGPGGSRQGLDPHGARRSTRRGCAGNPMAGEPRGFLHHGHIPRCHRRQVSDKL